MGWQQWWTASQSPPSLKAIVPEVAPPDHFYNCPYQNGIFVCWMMDWAGMMSARLPHSAGPGPYGGFAVNREAAYRQLPYIDFDKSLVQRRHPLMMPANLILQRDGFTLLSGRQTRIVFLVHQRDTASVLSSVHASVSFAASSTLAATNSITGRAWS
jgi:hypothetical protein